MSSTTNRRQLLSLSAAAAAIAAAGAGVTAAAARAPRMMSPALATAIAKARSADRAIDAHDRQVCQPLQERLAAAEAALPHTTVDAGPSLGGGRVTWSTRKPASIAITRMIVADARAGKARDPDILRAARLVQAAHLRRERAASRLADDLGLRAANAANNALGDAYCDAVDTVACFQVTNADDLAAKIAFLIEVDRTDDLSHLLADAQRLAAKEA